MRFQRESFQHFIKPDEFRHRGGGRRGFPGRHDPRADMMDGMHNHRGPGGFHPGHGGRRPKGDLRLAILQLLDAEPMHGYQIMQAIADKTGGRWTPSPGAVYPTISQLEDEGLVTVTQESGRKLVSLTDAGREQVAENRDNRPDPFGPADQFQSGHGLRQTLGEVMGATQQIGRHGTKSQLEKATAILAETRKSLYLLLAEGAPAPATDDADPNTTEPIED